jgi:hypothetical protein
MSPSIAVIDTSSIIQVRHTVAKKSEQSEVYTKLSQLVASGTLVYPKEVLPELKRFSITDPNFHDLALEWTQTNSSIATKHDVPLDTVKAVLQQVPDVLDPDKQVWMKQIPMSWLSRFIFKHKAYRLLFLQRREKISQEEKFR